MLWTFNCLKNWIPHVHEYFTMQKTVNREGVDPIWTYVAGVHMTSAYLTYES
jgi:hypothetical protein